MLSGATQLHVVLVYRLLKASTCFLLELSELLASVCPMSPATIIVGDFNIHVDSSSCFLAVDFLSLLDCFNIKQHVQGPMHAKGHTLDLVCSAGTTPTIPGTIPSPLHGPGCFWPPCHPVFCPCAPPKAAHKAVHHIQQRSTGRSLTLTFHALDISMPFR